MAEPAQAERLVGQLDAAGLDRRELAKILLTIFFAGYLVEKRDSLALVRTKFLGIGLPRLKDLGPIVVAWLVSLAVLVFERDLGTSLLFFGLFVTMLYIATQRRSWLILGSILFIAGAVLSYYAFGHVRLRVMVWLDPWTYGDDQGYQIVQSLFGLANGGMLGAGIGQGFPNLVPFANTDFIVAADTVVLPYRHIWSSSVAERAAMFDRPVIATKVGGLADQLADHPAGRVLERLPTCQKAPKNSVGPSGPIFIPKN